MAGNRVRCKRWLVFALVLSAVTLTSTSCDLGSVLKLEPNSRAPERAALLKQVRQLAELPEFATRAGSGGSASVPGHDVFTGTFRIDPEKYVGEDGAEVEMKDMLWDVFTRYGKRIEDHIALDEIPDFIERGGPTNPTVKATRYDWCFDAPAITLRYTVEWHIRGWTPDMGADVHIAPRPEIWVTYYFRVD